MLGAAGVLDLVATHFTHKNSRVRSCLAEWLGEASEVNPKGLTAHPEVVRLLTPLLSDSSAEVREQAVRAAGALHKLPGGAALISALEKAGARPSQIKAITGGGVAVLRRGGSAYAMSPSKPWTTLKRPSTSNGLVRRRESLTSAPSHQGSDSPGAGAGAACFHAFEGLDEITPITIYTEKELRQVVEEAKVLLEAKDDWQGWLAGLRTLAGLVVGGVGLDCKHAAAFVRLLRGELHGLVSGKVANLRSAVVREACRCVALLAQHLADAFAPLAELWLPALMKNVVLAKEVMSASGQEGIRAIIGCTREGFPRMLPQLLESARGKNGSMRACSVHYLRLSLIRWSNAAFDKHLDAICAVVESGLKDADGSVRSEARQGYWVLHRRFPLAADNIMGSLDSAVQRQLYKEEQSFDVEAVFQQGTAEEECCVFEQDALVSMHTSHHDSPNPPQLSAGLPCPQGEDMPPPVPLRSRAPMRSARARMSTGGAMRVTLPGEATPAGTGTGLEAEPTTGFKTRAVRLAKPLRAASATTAPVAAAAAGAVRMSRKVMPQKSNERAQQEEHGGGVGGGAMRVARDHGISMVGREEAGGDMERKPSSGALRVVRDGAARDDGVGDTDRRALAMHDFEQLVASTESAHWDVRLDAFLGLQQSLALEENAQTALTSRQGGRKLMTALVDHVDDSHYKVSLAALGVLDVLLKVCPGPLGPHLGHILPVVLGKLGASKEAVRSCANGVLDNCRRAYDPAQLCAELAPRVLDMTTGSSRAGLLEYLQAVIPHSASFLESQTHASALLGRLGSLLALCSSDPGMCAIITHTIEQLYHLDPDGFGSLVTSLPLSMQLSLTQALEGVIPEWGKENQPQPLPPALSTPEASRKPKIATRARAPSHSGVSPHDDVHSLLAGLARTSRSHQKVRALTKLKIKAQEGGEEFWGKFMGQVLMLLLEGASAAGESPTGQQSPERPHKEEVIRIKYVQGIRCLAMHQKKVLSSFTEVLVSQLIQCSADGSVIVQAELAQALADLSSVLPPEAFVSTLKAYWGSDQVHLQKTALGAFCSISPKLSSPQMMNLLRSTNLLQGLETAFASADLCSRQLAVASYVEMHGILGDALLPFMADMPKPKLKLVTIYIHKKAIKAGGRTC
ncbi:unnamed protein product [Chrysoparadoxa australica]